MKEDLEQRQNPKFLVNDKVFEQMYIPQSIQEYSLEELMEKIRKGEFDDKFMHRAGVNNKAKSRFNELSG